MLNALNARLKKKKKGFTLIELIIVIAIIAVIAAIAVPNYTKIRNDSKEKADIQSAESIKKITQTLVIDGTIKDGDTLTFTFNTDGTINTATAATGAAAGRDVKTYYADVKKPQQVNGSNYTVTIGTNGDVRVVVATS